ncbi:urokinase plasminogen activator surface receptor [Ictalurus punctatus]|uniref:Urokinase plasminogen activator surface receptor n=1 Tax=Ictalurus punctatus TaxID=7998 RepID=A0A9F7RH05_ICTPU|nr:urokinase plasminogen activator surface receptor [Ictalurus punctatus]
MKSQVILLLICMLFSKALSLTCQQCIYPLSATCTDTQTCADQCLTSTTSVYMSGAKVSDVNVKTCGTADTCVTGSMNLGVMKMVNNAKCCQTDLCNTETLPASPKQAPNGRSCYSCDANSCSGTVNCEGSEDRCISVSVQQGKDTISMKGCVSKSFCAAPGTTSTSGIGISNVQCCEGNLCNGAENFTLSFLLMIVPLLSSVLFY